jgi:hypothetical protein
MTVAITKICVATAARTLSAGTTDPRLPWTASPGGSAAAKLRMSHAFAAARTMNRPLTARMTHVRRARIHSVASLRRSGRNPANGPNGTETGAAPLAPPMIEAVMPHAPSCR